MLKNFLNRYKSYFIGALLCALTSAALFPVLNAEFIYWDETEYIINNPLIRGFTWKNIRAIFSTADLALYTPLTTFSFMFDYAVGGLNPSVYHAVNLLLHLANTVLVFVLGGLLGLPAFGAFFMAALFGVHPVHVESVAWVAERKDVLYSFFYLASLIGYLRFRTGANRLTYAVALVAFILSVLAKPMAVTLPAIMILCDWFLGDKQDALGRLKDKIPFIFISALIALYMLLPKIIGIGSSGASRSLARMFFSPLYAWAFYIEKLLLPINLSGMYGLENGNKGLIAHSYFAVLAAMLVVLFRKNKTAVFGALFFTTALLPVLQLVRFGPVLTADRYTYVPALGLFFMAAKGISYLLERFENARIRLAVFAGVFVLLAALGLASNLRARVWKDPITFWRDALAKSDSHKSIKVNLANAYIRVGQSAIAAPLLAEVVEQDPNRFAALLNMGICRLKTGDTDGGLELFIRAREIKPENGDVYANIASAMFLKGDYAAGFKNMDEAVRLRPGRNSYYYNIAYYKLQAIKRGQCHPEKCRAEAERSLMKFLEVEPEHKDALKMLCRGILSPERAKASPYCIK